MSIPTHRADLVRQAEERFDRLADEVDELLAAPAPAEGTPPVASAGPTTDSAAPAARDRDAADVLNHLHAWHRLLLDWLDADAAGRRPAYPAEGYTWRDLDRLNRDLRDRHRGDGDLAAAWRRLQASHRSVLARLDALGDAAIFSDGRAWLGGATLAEPVHECLGGHYAWALGALPALPAPH
ncbi:MULTISPECIES: ClbS/DfsB family four-helix bundle protein [unclassified Agromyces]|uniref:ClbS/DfsB family four-helix bundle protein n=1 Tax=unclassified Agromyces TaxID=2639701 RepID=UPI003014C51E